MAQKITMKDVARVAGVTQPTVSHVINKTAPISEEVTQRVEEAIKALGYLPNGLVKGAKMSKNRLIGLMVPQVHDDYFNKIVDRTESLLRSMGVNVLLCTTRRKPAVERSCFAEFARMNVDGVVIGYPLVDRGCMLQRYADIPMVELDGDGIFEGRNIPCVSTDNIEGGRMIADHFCEAGTQKPCVVGCSLIGPPFHNRLEGFRQGLQENGIELRDEYCFVEEAQDYDNYEMGYNLGARIVLKKDIDAVFATSDELAYGVLTRLREHHLNVPGDVMVAGFNNQHLCTLISPSLTTIMHSTEIICRTGLDILFEMIRDNEYSRKQQVALKPSLMIRQSTMRTGKAASSTE